RALATWQTTPPQPNRFDSEIALRCLFADTGTRESLLSALRAGRDAAHAQREAGREFIRQHVEADEAPYLERDRLNIIWWTLSAEQLRSSLGWFDCATREVERWSDTRPAPFDRRSGALATRIIRDEPILD